MFLDMIAREDQEWVHVDEDRAFLMRGDPSFYQILRALYGLKTSTRDHAESAGVRLASLGFKRQGMCTNLFEKITIVGGQAFITIVYQYVDDYFFACKSRQVLEEDIITFRSKVKTSEPLWNPDKGLGMEFERVREKRIIKIRMNKTIMRMAQEFLSLDTSNILGKKQNFKVGLALPKQAYIVNIKDFDAMAEAGDETGFQLDVVGKSLYMKLIGGILWISGYRWDIGLTTCYLTWFGQDPRQHHLNLALHVVRYLDETKDLPLILGGTEPAQILSMSDASEGTGPKMRSVIAYATRMDPLSGWICSKVKATDKISLSSFEAEINGYFEMFKQSAKCANVASEMSYQVDPVRRMIGDNEKAIDFINGEAEGNGLRHAEKRFSYIRQEVLTGKVILQWVAGSTLIIDGMTKPITESDFRRYRSNILGHGLLTDEEKEEN
jgi:hypothetical protein